MGIQRVAGTGRVIGFAVVFVLGWAAAGAAGGTDRYGTNARVVFQDDEAPGLGAAEEVAALESFGIGGNGHVLVCGNIGPITPGPRACWYGPPEDIRLVFRDDAPVPGFEQLGTVGRLRLARMSRNGAHVIFLTVDGDTTRIWTHDAGGTVLSAFSTTGRYRQASIANNGRLLVGSGVTYDFGDPADAFTIHSLQRGYAEALLTFASETRFIPGIGTDIRFDLEHAAAGVGSVSYVATVRDAVYLAQVGLVRIGYAKADADDRSALLVNTYYGGNRFAVIEGEGAEGAPSGFVFAGYGFDEDARLGRASICEDGMVLFQHEAVSGSDVWTGLWSYEAAVRTLIVGEGDPIAARPGDSVRPYTRRTRVGGATGEPRLWSLPLGSRQGSIVFPGEILETGKPAIFRVAAGQVTVLAEAGRPCANGSPYAWGPAQPLPADDAPFMTPYVNAPGQVLLWAVTRTNDSAGDSVGLLPWVIDHQGQAVPVVLPGDIHEFGAGDLRGVTPTSHHDAATSQWYQETTISDGGHVLVRVDTPSGWGILHVDPPAAVSHTPPGVVRDGTINLRLRTLPFRGQGIIELRSPRTGPCELAIYDLAGRLVRRLDTHTGAGEWSAIHWDGRNASGARAATGVYFLRVEQGARTVSRKITLVR